MGLEKKIFNEYFMNLTSGQPKVLPVYQFLIFLFVHKILTPLFIFSELQLASINLHPCAMWLSGGLHVTQGGVVDQREGVATWYEEQI